MSFRACPDDHLDPPRAAAPPPAIVADAAPTWPTVAARDTERDAAVILSRGPRRYPGESGVPLNVLSPASVVIAAFMLAALPGAQSARPAGSEAPRVRAGATRPASQSGSTWKTADLALCERLAELNPTERIESRFSLPNFSAQGGVRHSTPRLV